MDAANGYDIWLLDIRKRQVHAFQRTPFNEFGGRFSPDGQWFAYQSDESGGNEVYVQPVSGSGEKWRVSMGGGTYPRWSPNGKELFFVSGNRIMAVEVMTSDGFSASSPRMLFQTPDATGPGLDWDISPDGERFLLVHAAEQTLGAHTQLTVILNWHEALKRLVPTD